MGARLQRWSRFFCVSAAVAAWHVHLERPAGFRESPVWVDIALYPGTHRAAAAVSMRLRSRWRWPATAAVAGAFGLAPMSPFPPEVQHGRLEMTAIDVGQGDGILIGAAGWK